MPPCCTVQNTIAQYNTTTTLPWYIGEGRREGGRTARNRNFFLLEPFSFLPLFLFLPQGGSSAPDDPTFFLFPYTFIGSFFLSYAHYHYAGQKIRGSRIGR